MKYSTRDAAVATAMFFAVFNTGSATAATPISGWVELGVSASYEQTGDFRSEFVALPTPIVLPATVNASGFIFLDTPAGPLDTQATGSSEWLSSTAGSFNITAHRNLPASGVGEINVLTRYRFLATGNGTMEVGYDFSETGLTIGPGFTLDGNDGTFLTTAFSQGGSMFSLTISEGVEYSIFTSISLRNNGNVDLDLDWAILYDPQIGGVVPEPATWAMLILGFGLVGTSARRRRAAFV